MMELTRSFALEYHYFKDDGRFPNNEKLPVLLFKGILRVPLFFAAYRIKKMLAARGYTRGWKAGIYTYHHYHSNTHELLAVIKGQTSVLLGGDDGISVSIRKGDLLLIPAGVAHKNLGPENRVTCIGAYPGGKQYDMNYGKEGERPLSDERIRQVAVPDKAPVAIAQKIFSHYWEL